MHCPGNDRLSPAAIDLSVTALRAAWRWLLRQVGPLIR
jgi:hypothetical protein